MGVWDEHYIPRLYPNNNIKNEDKRFWAKYNEALVRRAVMLIDTDVLEKWDKYL